MLSASTTIRPNFSYKSHGTNVWRRKAFHMLEQLVINYTLSVTSKSCTTTTIHYMRLVLRRHTYGYIRTIFPQHDNSHSKNYHMKLNRYRNDGSKYYVTASLPCHGITVGGLPCRVQILSETYSIAVQSLLVFSIDVATVAPLFQN